MIKLFISQPMNGLSDEEIFKNTARIKTKAEKITGEKIELIDSFINDKPNDYIKNIPVWYLGKSIQFLSKADIAFFSKNWKNARGCKIEHKIAVEYGISRIEE